MMSNRLGHKYTDEQKQFIKENTGFSASEISKMFFERFGVTVTRNAVIGIVHRAGQRLKGRKSDGTAIKPIKKRPRPPVLNFTNPSRAVANVSSDCTAPKSISTEVADQNLPPLHISFFELNSSNCHWPFGSENFTYCGHPVKAGKVYCPFHFNVGRDKNYKFNPDGRRRRR